VIASAKDDDGPSVLQISRVSCALGVGCWVIGSFALVWALMPSPLMVNLFGMASLALVGVFSAFGLVRPKRIFLESDELIFRPVIGRERRIRRSDILGFEEIGLPVVSVVLVACRLRSASGHAARRVVLIHRHPLFDHVWFESLEAWLRSSPALRKRV
jgi:hypothetical protein